MNTLKSKLIQLFQDCSKPENEENYEQRVIMDSDFDQLAKDVEALCNKHLDFMGEEPQEIYDNPVK